ncbi:NAD-dependent succinate-semialdehyde dehydrogenase [Thiohalomonas denitrificans]|uniref:Succinate-semialdehyde dehydrogenase / glutarate-semialdehyde dehydrogenase n=1 Tax=Thiohalomonas denitrificans TaxID=415747 RepID=A0A1G5PS93_9GAMM|nr:NAD-dependent succinate-semialdehyde dehydrogenase [Thiohalomonas denitrificans]SCZ52485.1 succinate-semialdehyde dehydrogenase / glutarate-semialdehyde dehydrogenase [Thiohalomonas denitrificans]
MAFTSVNPATGKRLAEFAYWDAEKLDSVLQQVADATPGWAATPVKGRALLIRRLGETLREQREQLAAIITREMGKLIGEARGEIDKCAWLCDYYAESGPGFLADETLESDATRSLVAYQPLGTVLAVMPWNFPFWQVFRFAVPGLLAGNTGLLKHASNVPQCAKSIENLFIEAGFPEGVFRSLMIGASQVEGVIADLRVQAVTLTGSDSAGRKVAAAAGAHLKKSVLELGGSDPFVVLEDADLDGAARAAVTSRFLNGGQSCIAAKRFILVDAVAENFLARFKAGVEALVPGDPMTEQATLPPMARTDLRDDLHRQVIASIEQGAEAVTGCRPLEGEGAFYAASILDRVEPGMPAYSEELFGPVAIVLRARDEADALRIANDSPFGLGGSVWSADTQRGEAFARALECGCAFVNGMVKSDPRLPFGGIKQSGYGRELSHHGIREFVNAKTIWIR